jgi:predicted phosphodiesterase
MKVIICNNRNRQTLPKTEKREARGVSTLHIFISFLILWSTVLPSFAGSQEAVCQKLDALTKIQGSITFAVLGDTRSDGNDYSDLVRRLMGHKPDFVVNIGDMVMSPDEMRWDDFWKLSKPITVPYFLIVGNHEVYDKKSEELYKDQVDLPGNELYYSFTAWDSLFIFLDSNVPGEDRKIMDEQYKWLEGVLSTSTQRHKFLFVHHPLYPEKGMSHYGESLDKYPKERNRLETLFEKHKVNIVFVGHQHLYSRKIVGGVMHIITGGGGAQLYADEEKGGFNHFVLVTVDGDEVKGKVIDIKGKVRDTF